MASRLRRVGPGEHENGYDLHRMGPSPDAARFRVGDWDCGHRGWEPRNWRYVKHAAFHWPGKLKPPWATPPEPSLACISLWSPLENSDDLPLRVLIRSRCDERVGSQPSSRS